MSISLDANVFCACNMHIICVATFKLHITTSKPPPVLGVPPCDCVISAPIFCLPHSCDKSLICNMDHVIHRLLGQESTYLLQLKQWHLVACTHKPQGRLPREGPQVCLGSHCKFVLSKSFTTPNYKYNHKCSRMGFHRRKLSRETFSCLFSSNNNHYKVSSRGRKMLKNSDCKMVFSIMETYSANTGNAPLY